jgi:hypothetical protein
MIGVANRAVRQSSVLFRDTALLQTTYRSSAAVCTSEDSEIVRPRLSVLPTPPEPDLCPVDKRDNAQRLPQ